MGIIRFAIENPVKVAVGVILLMLFGTLSTTRIPIQLTPNIDEPKVTVETRWFGASPQEIEREVIERQEEKLKGVSDLKKMTSTSVEGKGSVVLEFHIGTDKDAALRDVSDKLRQVTDYPRDVDEPTIQAADSSINSPIAWLIFHVPDGIDPATLKDFAEDHIKPILERARGVAGVDVYGGREREIQIRIDSERMAAHGVTYTELSAAITRQNANMSAGTITSGKRDYTWRTIGQFDSLDDVSDTVVAYRDGGPIYIRDLGRVEATHKKQYSFVHSMGQAVLAMPVRRETGSNVMSVMANLRTQIELVNDEVLAPLGAGYELRQIYDETVYIESAIRLGLTNLIYGGVLAITVLLLFLRSASATAIVSLCIPISVVASFLVVTLLDRTLNVIMLAGMAFAVGMVVDNSIVVLENIFRHRQMGKSRSAAALDGAVEVWGAVLASTLTTMAVFLPVIFLEEEAGQLFRDIAIAISSAVALSLIVAMTVIPTVSAKLLGRGQQHGTQPVNSLFTRSIAATVHWINGSVVLRLAVCMALIGGSLFGSYALLAPTDYLPNGNRNLIFGFLITPPGYSLSEFDRMGSVLEETIEPYWDPIFATPDSPEARERRQVLDQAWNDKVLDRLRADKEHAEGELRQLQNRGLPGPEVKIAQDALLRAEQQLHANSMPPPPIANFFFVAFEGQSFMGAISQEPEIVRPLVNLFGFSAARLPGVIPFFFQESLFQRFEGSGNSIQLEVRGTDLAEVTAAGEQLQMAIMQRLEQFARPDPMNFALGRPEVRIEPDRVRAAEVGMGVQDVGLIVEACINGALIPGGYREHGEEIDMTIRVDGLEGATPEQVMQISVFTPTGRVVPLGSIVDTIKTTAAQQINHIEEMPSVTLTIEPGDMALETATRILEEEIIAPLRAAGRIPRSVITAAAGNADKLFQTRSALFGQWTDNAIDSLVSVAASRGGLAILITYLLMAALFESFFYPFVIMLSVIPATVGGFAGLKLAHFISLGNPAQATQKLDVLTMLGFVILIGIVVNNAILIVHQALNYMRGQRMDSVETNCPQCHATQEIRGESGGIMRCRQCGAMWHDDRPEGLAPRDAITASVRSRIRPIFMTAMTSVCGMLPLVVMPGAGSELYRGLGSVVVGGLLVSTIFTLFLVPAMFSLFVGMRHMVRPTAAAMAGNTPISD